MNKERKFFTIMTCIFFLTFGYSQNCFSRDVGGVVSGNVQWSGDIHVINDVTVSFGSMLTILPGTTVRFSAGREIVFIVNGRLIAEGSKNNMILFTSDANSPSPGDWDLIWFDRPSGDSSIKYCVVEYGVDSINTSGDESDSEIIIQNSIVRHSQDDGILIGPSSDMNIQFNTIYNNGSVGVEFHRSLQGYSKNVILKNNIIVNNVYGIANNSGQSYSSEYNNVWGNNSGDYNTWDGQINQNNDISADPLFEDINSDNVKLQQNSPCLTASECGGEIGAYGTCSDTDTIILEPPVLTVDISGNTVTLSWDAVPNADGYYLFADPSQPGLDFDGAYEYELDLGNVTSVSFDLWEGACFYLALQAYNGAGTSEFSNGEYTYIELIGVPPAPELTVTTSGNTVTLSWDAVPNADGYTLFYAPYPEASYIGDIDMGNQTSVSFDLWEGAAFYVAVKAYNNARNSDFSNIEYVNVVEPNSISALNGRLWDGLTNTLIANGYVFVVDEEGTVLGYSTTCSQPGPDSGWWQITGLPGYGEVTLIGFHPAFKSNLAVRIVSLNGTYQDVSGLTTSVGIPTNSDEFSFLLNLPVFIGNTESNAIADYLLSQVEIKTDLTGTWEFDGDNSSWTSGAFSIYSNGSTGPLVFNEDNTFTRIIYNPNGEIYELSSGTYSLSGAGITVTFSSGEEHKGVVCLSTDKCTLTIFWSDGDRETFTNASQTASIQGAWLVLPDDDTDGTYFVADGNGNITEHAFFNQETSPDSYRVQSDGSYTVTINTTHDEIVLIGTLTSSTGGTFSAEKDNETVTGIIKKVGDLSACQGTWSGTLTESDTSDTYDITFSVGSDGTVSSFSGFTTPVTGKMFCESGDSVAFFCTGETDEYNQVRISGTLSGDSLTGIYATDSEGDYAGTVTLTRSGLIGFTSAELSGNTFQFTDSDYPSCVFDVIFNNNNQLTTPDGETINYTINNGSIVWTDQFGVTGTISVQSRNGSVITASFSMSGGSFVEDTNWFADFSSLNNSATALKDWFITNGFWPSASITADGRVTNQAASFDGMWWVDNNVFYFAYPEDTGCVDYKAYKLVNDVIMFATDADHTSTYTVEKM